MSVVVSVRCCSELICSPDLSLDIPQQFVNMRGKGRPQCRIQGICYVPGKATTLPFLDNTRSMPCPSHGQETVAF